MASRTVRRWTIFNTCLALALAVALGAATLGCDTGPAANPKVNMANPLDGKAKKIKLDHMDAALLSDPFSLKINLHDGPGTRLAPDTPTGDGLQAATPLNRAPPDQGVGRLHVLPPYGSEISGSPSFSGKYYIVKGERYDLLGRADGFVEEGEATWYGRRFQGRKTSNGERYRMTDLTAAHRTLPFGCRVKVTHMRNGKWVVVRINDRGPWVGRSRIIDLSQAAAKALDMIRDGRAPVRLEALGGENLFEGRVVQALEGDRLQVESGPRRFTVTLDGVDCPEPGQPFAEEARQLAARLAASGPVIVERRRANGPDDFHAVVHLSGCRTLGQEMLRAGLGWPRTRQDGMEMEKTTADLHQEARTAKRGLWRDGSPVPPWDWRRAQNP
jgi:rare lipoprotein A (peptidoglycan hydrolase)